jgi:hypothetical protein
MIRSVSTKPARRDFDPTPVLSDGEQSLMVAALCYLLAEAFSQFDQSDYGRPCIARDIRL